MIVKLAGQAAGQTAKDAAAKSFPVLISCSSVAAITSVSELRKRETIHSASSSSAHAQHTSCQVKAGPRPLRRTQSDWAPKSTDKVATFLYGRDTLVTLRCLSIVWFFRRFVARVREQEMIMKGSGRKPQFPSNELSYVISAWPLAAFWKSCAS